MSSYQIIEGDSYEEVRSQNTVFFSCSDNGDSIESISTGGKPIRSSKDSDEISEPIEEILKIMDLPCCNHSYGGFSRLCDMDIDAFVKRTADIVLFESDEKEEKQEVKQRNYIEVETMWKKMPLLCIPEE